MRAGVYRTPSTRKGEDLARRIGGLDAVHDPWTRAARRPAAGRSIFRLLGRPLTPRPQLSAPVAAISAISSSP